MEYVALEDDGAETSQGSFPGDAVKRLMEKGLGELLAEPGVRHWFLETLKGFGCHSPSNHVLFYLFKKHALSGGEAVEDAFQARLSAFLGKNRHMRRFIEKLEIVNLQARDRDGLKAALLADLTSRPDEDALNIDETTSLEVVTALHTGKKLANVSDDLLEIEWDLRDHIETIFADITEPEIGWQALERGNGVAEAIRYNSGVFEFSGRDKEMDLLTRFQGCLSKDGPAQDFSWLLITGEGGEGKSRLAYEFVQQLSEPWIGGKLGRAEFEKLVEEGRWRPRRPTFFVIDYPAQFPDLVRDFFSHLASHRFDLPVRVLLLEREATGDWYRKLLPEGGDTPDILAHRFMRNEFDPAFPLLPLMPDAIAETMAKRFIAADFEPPQREDLIEAAYRAHPRAAEGDDGILLLPKALFAAAAAELAVARLKANEVTHDDPFERLSKEELLRSIIDLDRDQRWRTVHDGDIDDRLEVHENLLALATLCRGLARKTLAQLPESIQDYLPQLPPASPCRLSNDLMRAMGSSAPETGFDGLEPDILGEFFVFATLDRLRLDGADKLLLSTAYEISDQASYTALLAMLDFPEMVDPADGLSPGPVATEKAAENYARLIPASVSISGETGDWSPVDAMLGRIDRIRDAFEDNAEIALEEARAAFCATHPAGEAGDWQRVDAMLERIARVRAAFGDNAAIALTEVQAAVNVTNDAGEVGDWQRVDAMLERIDRVRVAFGDNAKIALAEAQASVNVSSNAAAAGKRRIDKILKRVDHIRTGFGDNAEIALREAKAAANMIGHACEDGDWPRVDEMFAWIDRIRTADAFRDNTEIAHNEANAVVNMTRHAGNAGDWPRVDAMFERIDRIREVFPDHTELALTEAHAAVNVTSHPCEAGALRVDSMLERIDRLRAIFTNNAEIALSEAKAAYNVTCHASKAGDWPRVDAMLERIDSISTVFSGNAEIALSEADAAFNVTNEAGRAGDWRRVDAMLERIAKLQAGFPEADQIALAAAKSSRNAYNAVRKANVLDRARCEQICGLCAAAYAVLSQSARLAQSTSDAPGEAVTEARFILMTLKAIMGRCPDNEKIRTVDQLFQASGVDWNNVPDLPPPE